MGRIREEEKDSTMNTKQDKRKCNSWISFVGNTANKGHFLYDFAKTLGVTKDMWESWHQYPDFGPKFSPCYFQYVEADSRLETLDKGVPRGQSDC